MDFIILAGVALWQAIKGVNKSTSVPPNSSNRTGNYSYWDEENRKHRKYMDDLENWTDDDEQVMRENYDRSM